MDISGPVADITEEALRILQAAQAADISLRLLGGLAIYLQSHSVQTNEQIKRSYKDLDFVALSRQGTQTKALFSKLGYEAHKTFNALHGQQRLLFWDVAHGRQVDIFVDRMQMCHKLDFRSRLHIDPRTLSLADLLLTKLQIVEINEKDLLDVLGLFMDFEVEGSDKGINVVYICGLTANDWGLYKTLETNLKKTKTFALEHNFPPHVATRIDRILAAMEQQPKSLSWKARAMIGERVPWYELPEEPHE